MASLWGGCSTTPPAPSDGSTDDASVSDAHTVGDGAADWGFRPNPNGFQFENYQNGPDITNLTPDDMRRIFGPMVCEGGAATGDCALVPPAQQWMENENKGLNGGHCEGMAVLAMQMFAGRIMPSTFGAGAANAFALTLQGNTALQREIAVWAVTQGTVPGNEDRMLTPTQVLDELRTAFTTGNPRMYVLGVYKPGYKDGHAIAPYALEDLPDGRKAIALWDNNYPNIARQVIVNPANNTWTYTASTNPNEPAAEYQGDATTFTLTLSRVDVRLNFPHACAFCGNVTTEGQRGSAQVRLTGDADLNISDGAGHSVGYDANGNLVNTLTGATTISRRSGDLWKNGPEPVYEVPRTTPLILTLDGRRLSAQEPSEVLITGPGYSLSVEDVQLDMNQVDTITVQPGAPDILYQAAGTESPTVVAAYSADGADYEIFLRVAGMSAGQSSHLRVNLTTGKAEFEFPGTTGASNFSLEVHRLAEDGTESVFTHAGNAGAAGDKFFLNYSAWGGNGMTMALDIDNGGNGTIDQTLQLTDSQ